MEKLKREAIHEIKSDISDEVVKDEALRALRACIQCGNCTAGCPSGRRTILRTREILRKACLGLEEVLKDEDLWLCTTCYTCYERCIRNVPVTDIIIKLRNLACQKGYMMPGHKGLTHMFIDTGHGVPLGGADSNWAKLREAYGLPPVPPTTHSSEEGLKECQTLTKEIGFDDLVGYKKKEEKKEEKKEGKK
jgi:heterodisulfide reductase subunit C